MKAFLLNLSFFTKLPVGRHIHYSDELYEKSIPFFPWTGLVIGLFLGLGALLIPHSSARGVWLMLLYFMVGGMMHLDGLSDSVDGLLSARDQKGMLEIMKDPHIGAFGVIALILYALSFYSLAPEVSPLWLVFMPVMGKLSGLFSASLSKYAKPEPGMGSLFLNHMNPLRMIGYGFLPILMIISSLYFHLGFWVGHLLIAVIVVFMVSGLLTHHTVKKIGGMTGDTIGMVIEITQMVWLALGGILCALSS